jgi:uncharacterized spore protein YtfJ
MEMVEKLFAVAQPGAVYSEPVTTEGYTVITASEVKVGMGIGFGSGGGNIAETDEDKAASKNEPLGEKGVAGYGSGGGGGGVAGGRPVAVINISSEGVQVEPVVDVTKIALAFFTTLGSMFFMLSKMRKASHRKG